MGDQIPALYFGMADEDKHGRAWAAHLRPHSRGGAVYVSDTMVMLRAPL
jgi:hypothetical protein